MDDFMKKNITLISLSFILIFIFSIIIYDKFYNDGMEQAGVNKVLYKAFDGKKWTSWKKNGISTGFSDKGIKKLKIKVKNDLAEINYYYDDNWHVSNKKNKNIYGIKIINSSYFLKKYDVYYRTYNKKDGWLDWTCNGNISGNANEIINKVEIKVIPKNVVESEYLKDFNNNKNSWAIDF